MIIENLPFDKYEVEPCPLTQYILSRKQASTCWQVGVAIYLIEFIRVENQFSPLIHLVLASEASL